MYTHSAYLDHVLEKYFEKSSILRSGVVKNVHQLVTKKETSSVRGIFVKEIHRTNSFQGLGSASVNKRLSAATLLNMGTVVSQRPYRNTGSHFLQYTVVSINLTRHHDLANRSILVFTPSCFAVYMRFVLIFLCFTFETLKYKFLGKLT